MVSLVLRCKKYVIFISEVTWKTGYCHFSTVNVAGLEMIPNRCYLLSVLWFLLHVLQSCSDLVGTSFSVKMLLWKLEPLPITHIKKCSSYYLRRDRCRSLSFVKIPRAPRGLTPVRVCRSAEHLQHRLFLSHPAPLTFICSVQDRTAKNQSPEVD